LTEQPQKEPKSIEGDIIGRDMFGNKSGAAAETKRTAEILKGNKK